MTSLTHEQREQIAWDAARSYDPSEVPDTYAAWIVHETERYLAAPSQPEARQDGLREALAELVALRELKDRLAHPSIADLDRGLLPELRRSYEQRKPAAWEAARAALARHPKGEDHA
jgi:hypothetical protein